ncbi:hypothetical protein LCGC14_2697540, partial [marine sediment metagenome]
GIETGIRLVMRHPEYARLLHIRLDEEMKALGSDNGRLAAERAIDGLIQLCPVEGEEVPDVR